MKENKTKLIDNEFYELIELYKDHVNEETNRRTRKVAVFWSFASILYVHSDLHLNIYETDENTKGIITPWGIPVTGITEDKFCAFLLIMVLYFIIKFIYSIWKINRDTNIRYIFMHFWSIVDHTKDLHTNDDSRKKLISQFEEKIYSRPDPVQIDTKEEYKRKYYTWLFIYRYRVIGLLDYFFAPIFFPVILGFLALISLAARLWF